MAHTQTVITAIAAALAARENCAQSANTEWFGRHTETIERIAREYLPRGSGIDGGTRVDLDRSTPERVVLLTSFHHMDGESGCYDGWSEHEVIVRASLVFGIDVRITGRDRNGIKEYLGDVFHGALTTEVVRG